MFSQTLHWYIGKVPVLTVRKTNFLLEFKIMSNRKSVGGAGAGVGALSSSGLGSLTFSAGFNVFSAL